MNKPPIRVAVIGAGMAGRAHANGYRSAPAVFGADLPEVWLVAIADAHEPFAVTPRGGMATSAPRQLGGHRRGRDIDAVSVVVANRLHREIVEAMLDAGKHVLCEKPLAPSVADGQAMVDAAESPTGSAAVGFTFRRSPAINAIREQITGGSLGPAVHFSGHYWCDYGFDPDAPMSWRYKGGPGSGALADIGTHLVDIGELLVRPGAERPRRGAEDVTTGPPGPAGHGGRARRRRAGQRRAGAGRERGHSDVHRAFAGGATGTFSVSRVAYGLPNALGFEVFCARGAAAFDLNRAAEFTIADQAAAGR